MSMIQSLGDYAAALRFRDMLQKLVKAEIDSQRPALTYATVTSIDRVNRKCGVQFIGAPGPVTVNMGAVQPSAVGQTVRIDGLLGDRFVSDVMGPAYMAAPTFDNLTLTGDLAVGDDATITGDLTAASLAGGSATLTGEASAATLRSTGNKVWFSSQVTNPDMIRFDDTANRYHFLADAAAESDPANASLAASGLYLSDGANFRSLLNAQFVMSGGGVFTTTSTTFAWSERFICIGVGKGVSYGTSGYFDISMPPDGTVITGYGGATDITVASGSITLPTWHVLWYELPIGGPATVDHTNWHVTNYAAGTTWEVPNNWVMVLLRSGATEGSRWRTGTGQEVDYVRPFTYQNSWTTYATLDYATPGYSKENGRVTLQGLVSSGTVSTGTTGVIATLPVGFRPRPGIHLYQIQSGGQLGRVDVDGSGTIKAHTGSNAWFSLNGISFVVGG